MMTVKLRVILVVALVVGLIIVINMIRRKSLELKYALCWLMAIVALMVVALVPGLMDVISQALGIYSVMNMIFFLGFCFLLVITFTLTVALSRLSNRTRKLAQQLALYEKVEKNEKYGIMISTYGLVYTKLQ